MRLATVRYEGRSHAARIEDDHVELLPAADVGALLAAPGGLEAATAVPAVAHAPKDAVVTLTLVPRPAKILCIGQNYLAHIEETGATPPEYPTVFAKYARALIGDGDPIVLPAVSAKVDWEVELVAVIGREVRNAGRGGGRGDRRLHRRQRCLCSRPSRAHVAMAAGKNL